MGSRVRVPSRPLLNFKNPCNSIDYRGFLVIAGHIVYEKDKGANFYMAKYIDKEIDYDYVWTLKQ